MLDTANHNDSRDKSIHSDTSMFGGHFDEDATYSMKRPNGSKDWIIFYTLSGEGYFLTSVGESRCGEGQVALLRCEVPHEYGTVHGRRWNFMWAHFPQLSETGYLPGDELTILSLPDEHLRERVYRAFRNFLHDSREQLEFWNALSENALREIILLVSRRLGKKLDSRIEHTLRLLSQSMREGVRINDLAAAVNLSPSRLAHLFKQVMGVSVIEHLNHMRLRQAVLLMEHMGRTATAASLDVGFNNYHHFAALFRKYYHISPKQYMRQRRDSSTD